MVSILSETETIKAVEEKEFIQMKGGYVAFENREGKAIKYTRNTHHIRKKDVTDRKYKNFALKYCR